jgi:mannose-1-phosphate guanylyltransferase
MRAVVLAAGLGTRLGRLTEGTAKAALDLGGRPIVAHVVAHLARCGFDEIAVNLHYRPEQVTAALGDGAALGVRISYFPEAELLGTAGTLARLGPFLDAPGPFLVHYADVLTDHDLGGLLQRHLRREALLTMLVHERPGSNSVVTVDDDWRVTEFLERPGLELRRASESAWVNSGVYACSNDILELVPAQPPSDMARDVVPRAVAVGRAYAEPLDGYRCAVDSPERLEEARAALGEGRFRSALQ